MNAPARNLNMTPSQLEAYERRERFRRSIAEQAAALRRGAAAPKAAPAIEPEPEPVPSPALVEIGTVEASAPSSPFWFFPVSYTPSVKEIQQVVCEFYGVTRADLCSARRTKNVVRPRQVAYYLCKDMTDFSLPAIGRLFGGRDHTTILHGIQKVTFALPRDFELAWDVAAISESIWSLREGIRP